MTTSRRCWPPACTNCSRASFVAAGAAGPGVGAGVRPRTGARGDPGPGVRTPVPDRGRPAAPQPARPAGRAARARCSGRRPPPGSTCPPRPSRSTSPGSARPTRTLTAAAMLAAWSDGLGCVAAAHALADAGLAPPRWYFAILDELWRPLRAAGGLVDRIDAITRLNRTWGLGPGHDHAHAQGPGGGGLRCRPGQGAGVRRAGRDGRLLRAAPLRTRRPRPDRRAVPRERST